MLKKNWEIQDGFKYKPSNCVVIIVSLSLLDIIWGIIVYDIWKLIIGGIGGIAGGIGIWVDYTIKKKEYLRSKPTPQTEVEVKTDLIDKE